MGKAIRKLTLLIYCLFLLISCSNKKHLSLHHYIVSHKEKFNLKKSGINPELINEKIVKVKIKKQILNFYVVTRKNKITRFECNDCHTNSEVTIKYAKLTTHGDILLNHGNSNLTCISCHDKTNFNFLKTNNIMKIDFDHVYELCGQCHFEQKKDWIGGAHGKRINNWAGKRVIKNCTSCHNPHSPKFPVKWPKTYSAPI